MPVALYAANCVQYMYCMYYAILYTTRLEDNSPFSSLLTAVTSTVSRDAVWSRGGQQQTVAAEVIAAGCSSTIQLILLLLLYAADPPRNEPKKIDPFYPDSNKHDYPHEREYPSDEPRYSPRDHSDDYHAHHKPSYSPEEHPSDYGRESPEDYYPREGPHYKNDCGSEGHGRDHEPYESTEYPRYKRSHDNYHHQDDIPIYTPHPESRVHSIGLW